MLTRKHFEAVASILREGVDFMDYGSDVHEFLVEEFVALFAQEHDLFDIDRFKTACAGQIK